MTLDKTNLIRTCSIWRALEVVGDTSILLILEASWIGTRRFDEFRARTGLLQALLSDRLKRLVAAGLFEKTPYSMTPLRHEYRMTAKGQDLYWVALMMRRWERKWAARDGKIDIIMRHTLCDQQFEPVPTCTHCSREISARDVEWAEGPGVGWMTARYSRRRQVRAATEKLAESVLMDEVAQLTGDRWASLILRSIFTGIRKFDEIRKDTGMASNILSERLNWLVGRDVLRRHEYSQSPPRYEYRLTEKGIDYFPILLMLLQWGDTYYVSPEGPPLLLRHRPDGHDLLPAVTCSCCDAPVLPRDVRFELVEATPPALRAAS